MRHYEREEYTKLKKANAIKSIILLVLLGVVIGMFIATWIRECQLDNMEWYENRIQCLEEAARYHNAWCDDANNLIK